MMESPPSSDARLTEGAPFRFRPGRRLVLFLIGTALFSSGAALGSPAFVRTSPAPASIAAPFDPVIVLRLAEDPGWDTGPLPSPVSSLRLEGGLSGAHPVHAAYERLSRALTVAAGGGFLPGETVRLSIGRGEGFSGATLSFQVATSPASARYEITSRLNTGSGPNMVAVGDLDRDGDADLVVSEVLDKDGLRVFLNNGFGRFTALDLFVLPGIQDPSRFALGDLDRDGSLDLVVVGEGSANLVVAKGKGNGRFEPTPVRPLEGATPVQAVIGDLNLDGSDEVIVAHLSRSDRLTVLSGEGGGALGRERRLRVGRGVQSMAVQDLDGDGDLDLAAANEEADQVIVLRNAGDGKLEPSAILAAPGRPEAIVAGDVNEDTIVDLITVNQGANSVSLLLGRGVGNDSSGNESRVEGLSYAAPVSWDVGERPAIPALADLDGDSDLDLAVPGLFSDDVTVLVNDGRGMFALGGKLPVDAGPVAVAAADFDGDGALDLAVASSVGDDVQILRNTKILAAAPDAGSRIDALAQNVPNPFNPTTEIAYELAKPGYVGLVIFNTSGKVVRTLVNRFESAGPHVAGWDGTSDEGDKLPSGIYFYRLTTDDTVELRRMTMIR